jgi:hypothetical protein
MKNRNDDAKTKTITISCKACAKVFDFTCALDFYEAVVAAAEEDGEEVVFTATCPECKAETTDPFLQLRHIVIRHIPNWPRRSRGNQGLVAIRSLVFAPPCWPIFVWRPQYAVQSGAGFLILRALWI